MERAGCGFIQLIVIRADEKNQLWALEQAARSGACGMVIGWALSANRAFNYQALRRLQLAAETGNTTLMLYRPLNAAVNASPAPTRLTLTSRNGQMNVRLIKRRGALTTEAVSLNVHPMHWTKSFTMNNLLPKELHRRIKFEYKSASMANVD